MNTVSPVSEEISEEFRITIRDMLRMLFASLSFFAMASSDLFF